MLKHALIRKYLNDQEVYAVIGHDILVYLKIAGRYLFLTALIYILYMILQRYLISHAYLTRTAALMWICIYFKWLYDIADEYLDSLVVTNKGLVFLNWNWLFDYKTDYIQWVSIESVSDEQNNFRDSLFKKGNISIKLEDEKIRFKEVSKPWEKVHLLLHRKTKILWRFEYHENETTKEIERDKYDLLVEALWEVVTEYVEQKKEQY